MASLEPESREDPTSSDDNQTQGADENGKSCWLDVENFVELVGF